MIRLSKVFTYYKRQW